MYSFDLVVVIFRSDVSCISGLWSDIVPCCLSLHADVIWIFVSFSPITNHSKGLNHHLQLAEERGMFKHSVRISVSRLLICQLILPISDYHHCIMWSSFVAHRLRSIVFMPIFVFLRIVAFGMVGKMYWNRHPSSMQIILFGLMA